MTQFGWILSLKRRDLRELNAEYANNTTLDKLEFLRSHFRQGFEQVDLLLVNGLSFASKQDLLGSGCIIGPEEECLKLKAKIEEMGIGTMIPNTDCIRTIA